MLRPSLRATALCVLLLAVVWAVPSFAISKESDLERVSIEVDAKPDAISIATRYPQNEGVEVAVEYTIHVPHGARVEHIGTVNGTLRVAGVETVEDLRTVNGNIEVFEAGGSVHAHTTNGN